MRIVPTTIKRVKMIFHRLYFCLDSDLNQLFCSMFATRFALGINNAVLKRSKIVSKVVNES